MATTHLHLAPRLRMSGATPQPPYTPPWRGRDSFTVYFFRSSSIDLVKCVNVFFTIHSESLHGGWCLRATHNTAEIKVFRERFELRSQHSQVYSYQHVLNTEIYNNNNNNNNNNNHGSTALYGLGPPLSEVTRSLCICGSDGPAHWPRFFNLILMWLPEPSGSQSGDSDEKWPLNFAYKHY
jgi:hypothetical protein